MTGHVWRHSIYPHAIINAFLQEQQEVVVTMSSLSRLLGLFFAAAMAAFSAYIFLQSGDWVAAVFFLGSVGYAVFFASTQTKRP